TVRVEWPSGAVQELQEVSADQTLQIVEPPKIIKPKLNGNTFEGSLLGLPGAAYLIETSSNLTAWNAVTTRTNASRTSPSSALIPASERQGYYRAQQQ